ncbi:DUF6049 family protein [Gryllotalpicola sp.]|uniref:DUF6049 family protein n=1 Tax=Gryllotalpicola sp. TaxID=1932787 RepID=UPI00261ADBFD|nr:DUF6049 family protein [Gryllotalpicola sp.]
MPGKVAMSLAAALVSAAALFAVAPAHAAASPVSPTPQPTYSGPRIGVAAVLPIVAAGQAAGLIPSGVLAALTAPGGDLTARLTVAQRNPAVTLAIDPMVLASIRVLGDAAPATAAQWLSALGALSNPSFALQYGDADPSAEAQAGLGRLLNPIGFDYAAAAPSVKPITSAAATAWPHSLGGIVWPAPGTVATRDFAVFARSAAATVLLDSANSTADALAVTPNAAITSPAGTALVIDSGLSAAIAAADSIALGAELHSEAERARNGTVVVVALSRRVLSDPDALAAAVTLAQRSPYSFASSLPAALATAHTDGLSFRAGQEDAARIAPIRALLRAEGAIANGPVSDLTSFASVLADPKLLTAPARNADLALLGTEWLDQTDAWQAAVAARAQAITTTLDAVKIAKPSPITQLSAQAQIPFAVTNGLDYPIDVVLRVSPDSPRIEIDPSADQTIDATTSANVLIPVKSQLSNGTVHLTMQLFSKSGVPIGAPVVAALNVHADWEGIGAAITGAAIAGFFIFGVVRAILRRRRERRADG